MWNPVENKKNPEIKDTFFGKITEDLRNLKLCTSTLHETEVGVWIAPKIPLKLRMWRLFPDWIPQNEKEMDKYLTYIKVPVYTVNWIKQKTLRIHKKLKNEAMAAFKELANKKFLVKDDEVWSAYWRKKRDKDEQSIHSYGSAIDINSWANGWIHRKTDKKSPYCITPQFAAVMKKHGFYRGWDRSAEREDPMHFSYTDS